MKNRLSQKNKAMILMCALAYMVFGVLLARHIGISLDFQHDLVENIFGISALFSILIFIIFLWGYSNFDGSKDTWWSDLLCNFFPYKDKRPHGKLFRDVIFPSLFLSLLCFAFGPTFLTCVIGIIWFVCFIFLLPVFFEYLDGNNLFYLPIILLLLEILLMALHKYELRRDKICYQRLAVVRTCFSIGLYAIGYVLLFLGIHISYHDLLTLIHHVNIDDVKFMDVAIILKTLLNILSGSLILYYCRKEHNILLYAEHSYYLYLRSFLFDDKDDTLLSSFPKDKQIMKIGNPRSTLLSNLFSDKAMSNDVLYLPTSNWQKHLDFYIYKAYSIISVVDDTQGVVWEMFHHPNYYNKILFFVDTVDTLSKLEHKLLVNEEYEQTNQLYQCIVHMRQLHIDAPFIFWIKDNRCYYDTDIRRIASLLSSRLNDISENSFDIATDENRNISKREDTESYNKWNDAVKSLSVTKKFFSYINAKFPVAISFLSLVFIVIANILIFCGIIWFGVEELFVGEPIYGILALLFVGLCIYGIYSEIK